MFSFGAVVLSFTNDLGETIDDNAAWINEFDGSLVKNTRKYLEDGGLHVFQRKKQVREEPVILKIELQYAKLLALAALRDAGTVDTLTLTDGRSFDAILDVIDGMPFFEDSAEFNNDDFFQVKLNFIQV